ncbi:hypothetical protein BOSE62_160383 [Bosea sp. 62]|nr:hypothetical protein BOSE62_160383 [Bosea sp. 62]
MCSELGTNPESPYPVMRCKIRAGALASKSRFLSLCNRGYKARKS